MAKEIKINETLELVKKNFQGAQKFRASKEQKWNTYYSLYRAFLDTGRFPWRSNVFIPYCFWTIETIVPRLIATQPTLLFTGREETDEAKAKTLEQLIKWEWRELQLDQSLEDLTREGLKYGTSFLKVGWEEEKQMPEVENVDILDLYIDPQATSFYNAEFVIFRTFRTIEDLKKNKKYKNLNLLEGLTKESQDGGKGQRYSIQSMPEPLSVATKSSDKLEILEYWTKDKLIVVAAQKVILRDDPNPFEDKEIPFVVFYDYPVSFELYGIGEIEHLETTQDEANSLRNQVLDANNLIINPMYEVDPMSSVNVRNIVSKPGAILPKGIKPTQQPILPASVFNLLDRFSNDIQQTTGVTDYQMGGESMGGNLNQTATGINLIQEAGNMRFKLKMRHLEDAIQRLGRLLVSRNQQLMTEEKTVRVIGKEGVEWSKINPADIKGNFDIVPEAGSTQPINKEAEKAQFSVLIRQLIELNGLALQSPASMLNFYEVGKRLLDKYDIKESEELWKQLPPPAPMGMGGQPQDEVDQMMRELSPEQVDEQMGQMAPDEQQILSQEILKRVGG